MVATESTPRPPSRPAGERRSPATAAAVLDALRRTGRKREIAAALGLAPSTVGDVLRDLARRGEAERIGTGEYRLAGDRRRPGAAVALPCRPAPSPIRDKIAAFLDRPRHAKHVADHIGRSVPNATGHLQAMLRLGLARRLETGVYVRADAPAAAAEAARDPSVRRLEDFTAERTAKAAAFRAALLAFLAEERTADDLAGRFAGCHRNTLLGALGRLRREGSVTALASGRFVAVQDGAPREGAVASIRGKREFWVSDPKGTRKRPAGPGPVMEAALKALDGPKDLSRLAEDIGRPVSSMEYALGALERRGLVERTARGVYRRTEAGAAAVRAAAP